MRTRRCFPVWSAAVAAIFLASVTASLAANVPEGPPSLEEGPFDAAPFGFPFVDEGGKAHGVRWAEPRKIRRVAVDLGEGAPAPSPDRARLQYWKRNWNGRPEPVLGERGAGGVGWEAMDDWTNGSWKDADARIEASGGRWTFTFAPTGEKEFPKLGGPGVEYRKTLKIRILFAEPPPAPPKIRAITDALLKLLKVSIRFGKPAEPAFATQGTEAIRLEAFDGAVRGIRPLSGDFASDKEGIFNLPPGSEGVLEADILMAVDPTGQRFDRTVVTVRSEARPFSFSADEVARGDRILIDDLGVLVTRSDDPITLEGYRLLRREFAGKTVYRRIFDEPEETLGRAWNDMPLKRPLYFVHGLPGNRNAMHQNPNGSIEITGRRRWFNLPKSPKDSARKLWPGENLTLDFGFPPDHRRGGRELRYGYLPLLRTWWQDGPVFYEETTLLDALSGDLRDIQGDDPTVLWMRIRAANTSGAEMGKAALLLASRAGGDEKLFAEGDAIRADFQGERRLRLLFEAGGRGSLVEEGSGLRWSLDLRPGEAHDLQLAIPSITLAGAEEIAALRKRDFESSSRRVLEFWLDLLSRGTRIETPEPWLNDFYKAHLGHLLVNCAREVGSDRLHAHVGTFGYGVYPDESAMMVSDLDRRGYHREAERCLESFLEYQSTVQMPGNFKSKEGLFYGSGGHEDGGYNKSHGWVLWLMAEHWKFTRDKAWMERAAPKLIAGCEWAIRERKAAEEGAGSPRPIERGFLPAGSLEDVTDYWHWQVTNSCTVWGLEALADALAEAGIPEGPRLQAEALDFRSDVLRGLEESRILAPVVRLRDGTYVPRYPSRLHERGRSHGWLRETLEGSIHLLITGLLPPESPKARWILEDYEDNLYISTEYGYAIPSFDRFWFSRGGFSMQANLLGGPLPYLYRDEIQHFLRAYFNSFSSAFYPEIRMMNEHSLPELGYPAGDHFKTSDEAQSAYWLRLMFVHEQGGDLYLGQGIPRYWLEDGKGASIERAASHHGPLSFRISSRAARGEIQAVLDPPGRNPPGKIYLRIRHPKGKPIQGVTVNGKEHADFDARKEWIVLPGNVEGRQEVVARY